jgi:hypothetical protein
LARLFETDPSKVGQKKKMSTVHKEVAAQAASAMAQQQQAADQAAAGAGQQRRMAAAAPLAAQQGGQGAQAAGGAAPSEEQSWPALPAPQGHPLAVIQEQQPLEQRPTGASRKIRSTEMVTIGGPLHVPQPMGIVAIRPAASCREQQADIRNFLQAAATPSKRGRDSAGSSPENVAAAKRIGLGEGENMEEGEVIEGDEGLRHTLFQASGIPESLEEARRRFGLTDEAMAFLQNMGMEATVKIVKKMEAEVKRMVRREIASEAELDKCRRSMVIQNPDRWVAQERATAGFGMADRVTAAIHKATSGMVSISDAFTIGVGRQGGPPPAVHVTFASGGQKGCWYKVLASMARMGGEHAEKARAISCRDSFPKQHLGKVKELAAKGMSLKREGKVGGFRVKAQGPACLPVLEVRDKAHRGPGGWSVYIPADREEDADRFAERMEPDWDNRSPQYKSKAAEIYQKKMQQELARLQHLQEKAQRSVEAAEAEARAFRRERALVAGQRTERLPDQHMMHHQVEGQNDGGVQTY